MLQVMTGQNDSCDTINVEDIKEGNFVQFSSKYEDNNNNDNMLFYGIFFKTTIHKRKFCGIVDLEIGNVWNVEDVGKIYFTCPMSSLDLQVFFPSQSKGKLILP